MRICSPSPPAFLRPGTPGGGGPSWGPLPPTATLHGVQELQGVAPPPRPDLSTSIYVSDTRRLGWGWMGGGRRGGVDTGHRAGHLSPGLHVARLAPGRGQES